MSAGRQRCIELRRYPQGMPRAEDFALVEREVAAPREGELLVETQFLSLDPAPRLRMNPASRELPPVALGSIVPGRGVGIVRASRHAQFREGEVVAGELGWQEQALVDGTGLRRVDPALGPVQAALGVLGPPGITAWCLVGPEAAVASGETVVIAAAAGAVGSTALQLARLRGARTVGLVASAAQARFVAEQLHADVALDCTRESFASELEAALAARGADVFLDSIGGAVHEAVVERIAVHGRIVAFGYISAYNADGSPREYGRMFRLIHRRAVLRGFLVGDHAARFAEAQRELGELLRSGRLHNHEQRVVGLEQTPAAFAALFTGDPIGKQLVQLVAPE